MNGHERVPVRPGHLRRPDAGRGAPPTSGSSRRCAGHRSTWRWRGCSTSGPGPGRRWARVLELHPGAVAVGVDKNDAMLDAARRRLAGATVGLRVAELVRPAARRPVRPRRLGPGHPPPRGPGQGRPLRRIGGVLRPGGRFVLGDVVIPVDHARCGDPPHRRPRPALDPGRPAAVAGRGRIRSRHGLVRARSAWSSGRSARLECDVPDPLRARRWPLSVERIMTVLRPGRAKPRRPDPRPRSRSTGRSA